MYTTCSTELTIQIYVSEKWTNFSSLSLSLAHSFSFSFLSELRASATRVFVLLFLREHSSAHRKCVWKRCSSSEHKEYFTIPTLLRYLSQKWMMSTRNCPNTLRNGYGAKGKKWNQWCKWTSFLWKATIKTFLMQANPLYCNMLEIMASFWADVLVFCFSPSFFLSIYLLLQWFFPPFARLDLNSRIFIRIVYSWIVLLCHAM